MKANISKHIRLDDWIFEIKMVRAIKVDSYGKPYSAIANINLNGDNAYIDGLMTQQGEVFNRSDYETFENFCQQLGMKQAKFDRFKNQQLKSFIVDLVPNQSCPPKLQLVK